MPKDRQKMEKQEFQKAVITADKQLPYIWNDDKDNTPDDFKRPTLGTFFGGVNFDKKGNIIR